MRKVILSVLAAVPLVRGAAMDDSVSVSQSSTVTESCKTISGVFPPFFGVVKTYTYQRTQRPLLQVSSTSTPTVQVTPPPITSVLDSTLVITETLSLPDVTSDFTITSTIFDTVLSTLTPILATSLSTYTITSTTFTTTSTVAASPGFLGVSQTDYPTVLKPRRVPAQRHDEEKAERRGLFGNWFGFGSSGNKVSLKAVAQGKFPLYPLVVNCYVTSVIATIITTIIVGPPLYLTVPGLTVTQTSTFTITSTSTYVETVTGSIFTTSETDTITSTVSLPQQTFTSTLTSTQLIPQPTSLYLACGAFNLLGPTLPAEFGSAAGDVISDIIYDSKEVNLVTTPGNSAYDCCVQCQQQLGCAYGGFTADGRCWLLDSIDSTCPAQNSGKITGQYVSAPDQGELDWAVYNSNCGLIGYGGADPDF